jgi:hypothetical protein
MNVELKGTTVIPRVDSPGDMNSDGVVNILDVILIMREAMGL